MKILKDMVTPLNFKGPLLLVLKMFTHKDRCYAVQLYVRDTKYFNLAVISRIGAACSCRPTSRCIRIRCDKFTV